MYELSSGAKNPELMEVTTGLFGPNGVEVEAGVIVEIGVELARETGAAEIIVFCLSAKSALALSMTFFMQIGTVSADSSATF